MRLIEDRSGTVAALGDLAYENGTATGVRQLLRPDAGGGQGAHPAGARQPRVPHGRRRRLLRLLRSAAGDPAKGYYSYDLGAWHVVVAQLQLRRGRRLRRRLAAGAVAAGRPGRAHPTRARSPTGTTRASARAHGTAATPPCGRSGRRSTTAGADVVLAGHEHNYERFAPQDAAGQARRLQRGIRQFVVGTGGRSHYGFGRPLANSQVRNDDTFGVLKLTLRRKGYTWNCCPLACRVTRRPPFAIPGATSAIPPRSAARNEFKPTNARSAIAATHERSDAAPEESRRITLPPCHLATSPPSSQGQQNADSPKLRPNRRRSVG